MLIETEKTLRDAWNSLNTNVSLLKKGEDVDLSDFDSKARIFCAELAKLPAIEAKKYQTSLAQLINGLNNLTKDIEEEMNSLERKISSMNERNVAHNAYGQALFLALQTAQDND